MVGSGNSQPSQYSSGAPTPSLALTCTRHARDLPSDVQAEMQFLERLKGVCDDKRRFLPRTASGHRESLLKCCRIHKCAMAPIHLANAPGRSRAESQGIACYSLLAQTRSSVSFGAWYKTVSRQNRLPLSCSVYTCDL